MKKIIFLIIMLLASNGYAYFQSDFLKNHITSPYFYCHYEYGGDLDVLKNYYWFLNSVVTGKLNLQTFDKSSSLLNSYIKFNHNVFGGDIFLYDKMELLDTSTTIDKIERTTIVVAHIYQNNKIYNNLKGGIEISYFSKKLSYIENDHNSSTSDSNTTSKIAGPEIYGGVSYSPVSYLNFILKSGLQISFNDDSQVNEVNLIGKISVKYYTQLYLFTPIWLSIESYYIKNFFENNLGGEFVVRPDRILDIMFGINQNRAYTSMRWSPFNFVKLKLYGEYELSKQNNIIITTGITLYYKSLGLPTFK